MTSPYDPSTYKNRDSPRADHLACRIAVCNLGESALYRAVEQCRRLLSSDRTVGP